MKNLLAAAALIASAAASAQTAPPTAPAPALAIRNPTPAAQALGVEIASLLNSEAITRVQTAKALEVSLPKALAGNPDFQALERAYPGATAVAIAAMRPELEAMTIQRLPDAWRRLGAIYAGTFTEPELRSLLAFYRSPTGIWLIQSIAAGTDLTDLMRRQVATPDARITAQDLTNSITKPGVAEAMKTATLERRTELVRFGLSPVGQKLSSINPLLAAEAAAWANDKVPGQDARIQRVVAQAIRDFAARSSAAKAKPAT